MATPDRLTSREHERARERRARRRRRALRWGGALLLLAVVFFAGLAVGKAIEEPPVTGKQILVRTLVATTLTPRETASGTVSNP